MRRPPHLDRAAERGFQIGEFLAAGHQILQLLRGDLASASAAAAWFADEGERALLPGGTEYYDVQLERFAASIATAPDMEAAGLATGVLAEGCGRCHASVPGAATRAFPAPEAVPWPEVPEHCSVTPGSLETAGYEAVR